MTEELLREWLRGSLQGEARRAVSRWMLTCTDPRLPELLRGLSVEATQDRLDQELARRGPIWAAVVDRWRALLELGRAAWLGEPGAPLVLAEIGGPLETLGVWAEAIAGRVRVVVQVPPQHLDAPLAAVLTDDGGGMRSLQGERTEVSGVWLLPLPDDAGARPTLWIFLGLSAQDEDVVDLFRRGLELPVASCSALRVTEDLAVWETPGGALGGR